MKSACVTTNVLDLWAEPRYNSERKSQLLYGDVVTLGTSRHGFVRVTEKDGYTGWADERFFDHVLPRLVTSNDGWEWGRVAKPTIKISQAPHVLFYGSRLLVRSVGGRYMQTRLANGEVVGISLSAIELISKARRITARRVIVDAKKFLGTPYLWGGITVHGLDCSGLTRSVFRQVGIDLPRDTKDQIKVGTKVDRADLLPGDLLFFDRHVAIALRGGRIIHSSKGGGGVRIQSLVKGQPEYRADLDRDIKAARRHCASD